MADTDETWIKILTKFGLGTVIALFLIWRFTGQFELDVRAVRQNMTEHVEASKSTELTQRQILAVTQQGFAQLVNIAIQNCKNQANTRVESDRCFEAQYKMPERDR